MKKFLPYFKLLLPVKWRFIIAIVTGIIYGLASGFGLPFMTAKIFPLIFSSEQKGISLYLKTQSEAGTAVDFKHVLSFGKGQPSTLHQKFLDLSSFPLGDKVYYDSSQTSSEPTPIPPGSKLTTSGTIELQGEILNFNQLFLKQEDGAFMPIDPYFYLNKGNNKFQKISSGEFKTRDNSILLAVLMLPTVFLIRGVAGYVNQYYTAYCGQFVLERIRTMVFEKFQILDLAYFQRMGTGDLMTRFLVQTTRLQNVITTASNSLIREPVALLSAIAALIYLAVVNNATIFILICVGIIPAIIMPVKKFTGMMLKKMRSEAKGEILIGAHLQENLSGVRDIRSFNLEERETANFKGLLAGFFKQRMKMTKYKGFVSPTVEVITATGVSLAIYYSARNGMTLETVIPLIVALYMSYEPIKKIANLQTQLVMGQLAIEMMDRILDTEPSVIDPTHPKRLPSLRGDIHFKDVIFKYDTGKPALNKINCEIQSGEVIALVGPSGAGKSTFTHLISRTYEITQGKIFFDNHDVTEHALHDLRAQVSVVSQSPYIFDDTIKNNIRLGKLDATDAEIYQAAERANCAEFINKLPKGYDTPCGENATLLSGGQKQRLAIARAFLKDAPILILDEATSALDAESEQTVQAALAKLVKGRTTLLIAHRFSSIQIANRILVFDNGEIVADGTHDALLESSLLYKELYLKQNI